MYYLAYSIIQQCSVRKAVPLKCPKHQDRQAIKKRVCYSAPTVQRRSDNQTSPVFRSWTCGPLTKVSVNPILSYKWTKKSAI